MKPDGLTRAELAHYAPIDAEVAAYLAKHAQDFFDDVEEFYDPAGCYDDGHNEGSNAQLKEFRKKFLERAQELNSILNAKEVVDIKLSEFLHDLIEELE